jgi:uncharacterized membrane protein YeaQ/YmgE (transglycosylase-associated protein family)
MELIRDLVIWAIIGIAAGWLAGVITKTDRNIWGDLLLGLAGALIAGFVLRQSIGPENNLLWSIIAATIVAVVLVLIKNMVTNRST